VLFSLITFIKHVLHQKNGKPNNFKILGSITSEEPKQDISKSIKDVINVQGAWHSTNTLLTIVHGSCFRNHNPTIIIKRSPLLHHPETHKAYLWVLIHGNLHHYPATAHQVHAYTINIIRDYCMIFSILAVVSARDSHIKPGSESGGLTPRTIWQILCHNLFFTYFTLTFFKHWLLYCRKDRWTDKLRK